MDMIDKLIDGEDRDERTIRLDEVRREVYEEYRERSMVRARELVRDMDGAEDAYEVFKSVEDDIINGMGGMLLAINALQQGAKDLDKDLQDDLKVVNDGFDLGSKMLAYIALIEANGRLLHPEAEE